MKTNNIILAVSVGISLFFIIEKLITKWNTGIPIIIIFILIAILSYFIYRCLRLIALLQKFETIILSLRKISKESLNRLNYLDDKHFFRATEQTVIFFENLKTIQESIDSFLGEEKNVENKKKKN